MKKIIIATTLSLMLTGCVFVAGAAAGAAGIAVVYDHRRFEKIIEDQRIANDVSDKIRANAELRSNSNIEVSCFNKIILLTGQVATEELKKQAGQIARSLPEASHVYNQLSVKGSLSAIAEASDTWITTKVKTQMLAEKGLKSGTIKVVTESSTVYLMGIVSKKQADMAVQIARRVTGVQRVVKIFQYTD